MGVSNFDVISANAIIGGASGGIVMGCAATVRFVDKINGSDGNIGTEPLYAYATIEKALAASKPYDVIYVLDPGTSESDPVNYQGAAASWTVPVASKGLALIGACNSAHIRNGKPLCPNLKAYAAATPIITVNAPNVTIENLRIKGEGTEVAGIEVADFSAGVYEGMNLSVNNCMFHSILSTGDRGAISIIGQWNTTITNCFFNNCGMGISIKSSGSTCVGTVIDTVKFHSDDGLGTAIKADIYIYCQGQSGIMINNVMIGHDVPIMTGTKGACIAVAGGAETGLISNVNALDADGTCHATTGTIYRGPATIGICKIYNGADALKTI